MIRLKDYIIEHNLNIVNIFESKLNFADFSKHDFKYTKHLISMLIDPNNPNIKLGEKGKDGFFSGKQLTKDTKEQLQKYFEKINNINSDINTNICRELYKEFNNILTNGNINLNYSSFFKGQFSGYEGQTMGQMCESLCCYIFNNKNYNINEWCKFMNIDPTMYELQSWHESEKKSVELIKSLLNELNENPSNYFAYHVDGNNFDLPEDAKQYLVLSDIFKGKNEIIKINPNAKDIYSGGNKTKDKWNPADIVIIKKISKNELDLVLTSLQECVDGKAFNAKLVQLLGSNIIIPISLKKITKDSGKIYGHNVANAKELDIHKIDLGYIKLGEKFKENDDKGVMMVFAVNTDLDEKTEIQFRRATNKNPSLSIEVRLASKLARGGKGVEMCKQKLGIPKDNSYFKTFNSNEELYQYFKDNGFKDSSKHLISDIPDNLKKYDLYNRVCYRGFCGLFDKYKKYYENDLKNKSKDEIIKLFIEFVYLSCVDCPGSYYIIK